MQQRHRDREAREAREAKKATAPGAEWDDDEEVHHKDWVNLALIHRIQGNGFKRKTKKIKRKSNTKKSKVMNSKRKTKKSKRKTKRSQK